MTSRLLPNRLKILRWGYAFSEVLHERPRHFDIRAGRVRDTVRVEDQIEGIPGLKTGSVVGRSFFAWANGVTTLYAGPVVSRVNTSIGAKTREQDSQDILTGE